MHNSPRRISIAPVTQLQLSLADARSRAVLAQHLHTAHPASPQGVVAAFQQLRCVQLDPISAVARSQVLVLRNRTAHTTIDALNADFEAVHTRERRVFEYWAHCASLVLTEDYPIHSHRMRSYRTLGNQSSSWAIGMHKWANENKKLKNQILREIKKHGPLPSSYFEDEARATWYSTGWTSGRNVNKMLDHLWLSGVLMVSGRSGLNRLWDLAERVLPEWAPKQRVADATVTRSAIVHAVRALGVGTEMHIKHHFVRGRYPELKTHLAALTKSGVLTPCTVEGMSGTHYALSESLAQPVTEPNTTRLLSPFDNLICDRARSEALFDFEFRIEIYVPPAKRKFGYYVLPILHNNALIGRLSPAYDRASRLLTIEKIYAEAQAPRSAETGRAIRDEIERLGSFLGATKIKVGPTPTYWKAAAR